MKRFKMDKFFQIPMFQEPADGESRWSVRSPFLILMTIVMVLVLVVGIIQHKSSTSRMVSTPAEKRPSTAELLKLYDPSSLVETKALRAFPADLQSILGVHATGYARLADVGEPCNPTDAIGNAPGRCFYVGGVSATSALVAFKVGGIAGQSNIAEGYVHVNATWSKVESWDLGNADIGYSSSLNELQEMVRLAAEARRLHPQ